MPYEKRKNGREEMSQENSVSLTPQLPVRKRNIKVIALAIICVILAASLVGVIAVYQPTNLQAQIADKDKTISSLNQTISNLQAQLSTTTNNAEQIAYLEQELSVLNDTLTSAYENVYYYENVTALKAGAYVVYQQQATIGNNTWADAYNNALSYAGYIVVQATSTSNTTYAETLYSSYGVNFDQNVTLGTSGTAYFPVLPSTVEVRIGNLDQTNSATVTVTVAYYY